VQDVWALVREDPRRGTLPLGPAIRFLAAAYAHTAPASIDVDVWLALLKKDPAVLQVFLAVGLGKCANVLAQPRVLEAVAEHLDDDLAFHFLAVLVYRFKRLAPRVRELLQQRDVDAPASLAPFLAT
jgi:hypothetical protein